MEIKATKEDTDRFLSDLIDSSEKKSIRDALDMASSMYQYEVVGNPDTFDQYNAGWQDAVDYLSQLLGFVD